MMELMQFAIERENYSGSWVGWLTVWDLVQQAYSSKKLVRSDLFYELVSQAAVTKIEQYQ